MGGNANYRDKNYRDSTVPLYGTSFAFVLAHLRVSLDGSAINTFLLDAADGSGFHIAALPTSLKCPMFRFVYFVGTDVPSSPYSLT